MERQPFAKNLEERFKGFLNSRAKSQNLDEMDVPEEHQNLKRADYLLNGKIIVELKSLQSDPSHKIEKILEPHREREEFPLDDGPLKDILKKLPDGDAINTEIFFSVTKSVQQCFEKADKQIRDTKIIIDKPNATGVLALLNERISVLEPKVIAYIARYMMDKKSKDGSYRYKNIHFVYFISEAHFQKLGYDGIGTPLMIIDGPNAKKHLSAIKQFERYNEEWGKYNNVPLFYTEGSAEERVANDFQAFGNPKTKDDINQIRHHKLWRREYRDNPYLRNLSEEDFIIHGRNVINRLAPHLLKGFPIYAPEEKQRWMIAWTHFLEEAQMRGLSIEELKSSLDKVTAS